jgi:hypothetical protein
MAVRSKQYVLIRLIAAFVAAIFLSEEVARAAASAAPQAVTAGSKSPAADLVGSAIQRFAADPSFLPWDAAAVRADRLIAGTNGRLIILMRDAHANLDAQKNLRKAAEFWAREAGIDLILSEAAWGEAGLGGARGVLPPAELRRASDRLLWKNLITGHEHLTLTSDLPVRIVGIDDAGLYRRSWEVFRRMTAGRAKAQAQLARSRAEVDSMKRRDYPAALLDHEARLPSDGDWTRRYRAVRASAAKAGVRFDPAAEASLTPFVKAEAMEKAIDHDRLAMEQERALGEARARCGACADELIEAFSKSAGSIAAARSAVSRLALASGRERWEAGSELGRYAAYLESVDALDPELLDLALEVLEQNLYAALTGSRDARVTRFVDRHTRLLEAAYALRLTPEESRRLDAELARVRPVSWQAEINDRLIDRGRAEDLIAYEPELAPRLVAVRNFYRLAALRDRVFARETDRILSDSGRSAALAVTGGYHTDRLVSLLAARGYSVAVFTPLIASETDPAAYEKSVLSSDPGAAAPDPGRSALMMPLVRTPGGGARLAAAVDELDGPARVLGEHLRRPGPESDTVPSGARMADLSGPAERVTAALSRIPNIERDLGRSGTSLRDVAARIALRDSRRNQAAVIPASLRPESVVRSAGELENGVFVFHRAGFIMTGDVVRSELRRVIRAKTAAGDRVLRVLEAGIGKEPVERDDIIALTAEALAAEDQDPSRWTLDIFSLDIVREFAERADRTAPAPKGIEPAQTPVLRLRAKDVDLYDFTSLEAAVGPWLEGQKADLIFARRIDYHNTASVLGMLFRRGADGRVEIADQVRTSKAALFMWNLLTAAARPARAGMPGTVFVQEVPNPTAFMPAQRRGPIGPPLVIPGGRIVEHPKMPDFEFPAEIYPGLSWRWEADLPEGLSYPSTAFDHVRFEDAGVFEFMDGGALERGVLDWGAHVLAEHERFAGLRAGAAEAAGARMAKKKKYRRAEKAGAQTRPAAETKPESSAVPSRRSRRGFLAMAAGAAAGALGIYWMTRPEEPAERVSQDRPEAPLGPGFPSAAEAGEVGRLADKQAQAAAGRWARRWLEASGYFREHPHQFYFDWIEAGESLAASASDGGTGFRKQFDSREKTIAIYSSPEVLRREYAALAAQALWVSIYARESRGTAMIPGYSPMFDRVEKEFGQFLDMYRGADADARAALIAAGEERLAGWLATFFVGELDETLHQMEFLERSERAGLYDHEAASKFFGDHPEHRGGLIHAMFVGYDLFKRTGRDAQGEPAADFIANAFSPFGSSWFAKALGDLAAPDAVPAAPHPYHLVPLYLKAVSSTGRASGKPGAYPADLVRGLLERRITPVEVHFRQTGLNLYAPALRARADLLRNSGARLSGGTEAGTAGRAARFVLAAIVGLAVSTGAFAPLDADGALTAVDLRDPLAYMSLSATAFISWGSAAWLHEIGHAAAGWLFGAEVRLRRYGNFIITARLTKYDARQRVAFLAGGPAFNLIAAAAIWTLLFLRPDAVPEAQRLTLYAAGVLNGAFGIGALVPLRPNAGGGLIWRLTRQGARLSDQRRSAWSESAERSVVVDAPPSQELYGMVPQVFMPSEARKFPVDRAVLLSRLVWWVHGSADMIFAYLLNFSIFPILLIAYYFVATRLKIREITKNEANKPDINAAIETALRSRKDQLSDDPGYGDEHPEVVRLGRILMSMAHGGPSRIKPVAMAYTHSGELRVFFKEPYFLRVLAPLDPLTPRWIEPLEGWKPLKTRLGDWWSEKIGSWVPETAGRPAPAFTMAARMADPEQAGADGLERSLITRYARYGMTAQRGAPIRGFHENSTVLGSREADGSSGDIPVLWLTFDNTASHDPRSDAHRTPIYGRIGEWRFASSDLKAGIEELARDPEELRNVIYIPDFKSSLTNVTENLAIFAAAAAMGVASVDLEDRVFLDQGSADGILSILALSKGARRAVLIDMDPSMRMKVLRLAQANGIDTGRIVFLERDLNDSAELVKELSRLITPEERARMAAASNIGDHQIYPMGTYLNAIEAARALGAQTLISGGHIIPSGLSRADVLVDAIWSGGSERARHSSWGDARALVEGRMDPYDLRVLGGRSLVAEAAAPTYRLTRTVHWTDEDLPDASSSIIPVGVFERSPGPSSAARMSVGREVWRTEQPEDHRWILGVDHIVLDPGIYPRISSDPAREENVAQSIESVFTAMYAAEEEGVFTRRSGRAADEPPVRVREIGAGSGIGTLAWLTRAEAFGLKVLIDADDIDPRAIRNLKANLKIWSRQGPAARRIVLDRKDRITFGNGSSVRFRVSTAAEGAFRSEDGTYQAVVFNAPVVEDPKYREGTEEDDPLSIPPGDLARILTLMVRAASPDGVVLIESTDDTFSSARHPELRRSSWDPEGLIHITGIDVGTDPEAVRKLFVLKRREGSDLSGARMAVTGKAEALAALEARSKRGLSNTSSGLKKSRKKGGDAGLYNFIRRWNSEHPGDMISLESSDITYEKASVLIAGMRAAGKEITATSVREENGSLYNWILRHNKTAAQERRIALDKKPTDHEPKRKYPDRESIVTALKERADRGLGNRAYDLNRRRESGGDRTLLAAVQAHNQAHSDAPVALPDRKYPDKAAIQKAMDARADKGLGADYASLWRSPSEGGDRTLLKSIWRWNRMNPDDPYEIDRVNRVGAYSTVRQILEGLARRTAAGSSNTAKALYQPLEEGGDRSLLTSVWRHNKGARSQDRIVLPGEAEVADRGSVTDKPWGQAYEGWIESAAVTTRTANGSLVVWVDGYRRGEPEASERLMEVVAFQARSVADGLLRSRPYLYFLQKDLAQDGFVFGLDYMDSEASLSEGTDILGGMARHIRARLIRETIAPEYRFRTSINDPLDDGDERSELFADHEAYDPFEFAAAKDEARSRAAGQGTRLSTDRGPHQDDYAAGYREAVDAAARPISAQELITRAEEAEAWLARVRSAVLVAYYEGLSDGYASILMMPRAAAPDEVRESPASEGARLTKALAGVRRLPANFAVSLPGAGGVRRAVIASPFGYGAQVRSLWTGLELRAEREQRDSRPAAQLRFETVRPAALTSGPAAPIASASSGEQEILSSLDGFLPVITDASVERHAVHEIAGYALGAGSGAPEGVSADEFFEDQLKRIAALWTPLEHLHVRFVYKGISVASGRYPDSWSETDRARASRAHAILGAVHTERFPDGAHVIGDLSLEEARAVSSDPEALRERGWSGAVYFESQARRVPWIAMLVQLSLSTREPLSESSPVLTSLRALTGYRAMKSGEADWLRTGDLVSIRRRGIERFALRAFGARLAEVLRQAGESLFSAARSA